MSPSGDDILAGKVQNDITVIIKTDLPENELTTLFQRELQCRIKNIETIETREDPRNLFQLIENILPENHEKREKPRGLTVSAKELEQLIASVKELLMFKSTVSNRLRGKMGDLWAWFEEIVNKITSQAFRLKLVSLKNLFSQIPTVTLQLAKETGKKVDIYVDTGDISLDKETGDILLEVILSLIRNSVEHGIESPEDRIKKGKLATGAIKVTAWRERNTVIIEVEDDGKGVDPKELVRKAVQRRLIPGSVAANMDDTAALTLLEKLGTTNPDKPYSLSIGTIKNMLKQIDGKIVIDTEPGKGLRARLEIPLTTAALETAVLPARAGDTPVAIPLNDIVEVLQNPATIRIGGKQYIHTGHKIIEAISLPELLNIPETQPGKTYIVVRSRQGRHIAIRVSKTENITNVLIRPLPRIVKNPYFTGVAVLENGEIYLVLTTAAV